MPPAGLGVRVAQTRSRTLRFQLTSIVRCIFQVDVASCRFFATCKLEACQDRRLARTAIQKSRRPPLDQATGAAACRRCVHTRQCPVPHAQGSSTCNRRHRCERCCLLFPDIRVFIQVVSKWGAHVARRCEAACNEPGRQLSAYWGGWFYCLVALVSLSGGC